MCGIAGFYSSRHSYTQEKERWRAVLEDMNRAQKRRGPDEEGISLTDHCGLAHEMCIRDSTMIMRSRL